MARSPSVSGDRSGPVAGNSAPHPATENSGVERLDQKSISTGLKAGGHSLEIGVHAHHQNRDITGVGPGTKLAQQFYLVHSWDVDVEQDQIRRFLLCLLYALGTVTGHDHSVLVRRFQRLPDRRDSLWVAVHQKNVCCPAAGNADAAKRVDLCATQGSSLVMCLLVRQTCTAKQRDCQLAGRQLTASHYSMRCV